MIVLSANNVQDLLPMGEAIELIEKTMVDVATGKCSLPLRSMVNVGGNNNLGMMPGVLEDEGVYGVKLLSLFPQNPARGLSSHIGAMVIFDPDTGAPSAIINADALTAIRTAAASAAATRALSKKDASTLAIIGCGEQAQTHISALTKIRNIKQINICGRTRQGAKNFEEEMSPLYPDISFSSGSKMVECVAQADIVCSVTSSREVVLHGEHIQQGTHINAVGASIPSMQEIDVALVKKSKLFVDYKPSALAQAKEIIEGLADGDFEESHILGEIGQVYSGEISGRTTAKDITLYRSLGVAAQDLACAEFVRNRALETGVGILAKIS